MNIASEIENTKTYIDFLTRHIEMFSNMDDGDELARLSEYDSIADMKDTLETLKEKLASLLNKNDK